MPNFEQEMPPEAKAEQLAAVIDKELKEAPNIPSNRKGLFNNLSENRAIFLAALLATTGVTLEAAAEEFAYEKPNNVISTDLPKAESGDKDTMFRYGHELNYLKQDLKTGKTDVRLTMITQIRRMMLFCEKHGVDISKIYDLSGVPHDVMEAAEDDVARAHELSQKRPSTKAPKTLVEHEILRKKSL